MIINSNIEVTTRPDGTDLQEGDILEMTNGTIMSCFMAHYEGTFFPVWLKAGEDKTVTVPGTDIEVTIAAVPEAI
jgi:hypothetical protein